MGIASRAARGYVALILGAGFAAVSASAVIIDIDLEGKAGSGLLPGNTNGSGTPDAGGTSTAVGGESGAGFSYDTNTNQLSFDFSFSGLAGGLRDAAGGIHFHRVGTGLDPFNETGGIVFFLNNGADANVVLSTALVAIGSSSGGLAGVATLTEAQEADLLAGFYYLNIHSDSFPAGEIRGNLVPEPTTAALLSLAALALIRRRA